MHKNDVFQNGRIKFATWVLNTNTDSWVPAQNSNQNPQDQSSSGNMKLELELSLVLVPIHLRNPGRIHFCKKAFIFFQMQCSVIMPEPHIYCQMALAQPMPKGK